MRRRLRHATHTHNVHPAMSPSMNRNTAHGEESCLVWVCKSRANQRKRINVDMYECIHPAVQPSSRPAVQSSSHPAVQPSSRPAVQPSIHPSLPPSLPPCSSPLSYLTFVHTPFSSDRTPTASPLCVFSIDDGMQRVERTRTKPPRRRECKDTRGVCAMRCDLHGDSSRA